ncbi:hypothetical protein [Aeromonas sp. R10-1]|uniref:hypothetical protein n=1 Tax=Aeromonas sp. R10-1 TaxID=3138457 RepID=UPI0034A2CD02
MSRRRQKSTKSKQTQTSKGQHESVRANDGLFKSMLKGAAFQLGKELALQALKWLGVG